MPLVDSSAYLHYRKDIARSGFPGPSSTKIGTTDDLELHKTKLALEAEQFVDRRVRWLVSVRESVLPARLLL